MSFDIYLHTSHLSDQIRQVRNPMTGELFSSPIDQPLTDIERNSVQNVLSRYFSVTTGDKYQHVHLDGCGPIEVNLEIEDTEVTGGMISMRGFSISAAEFLFELADAGNFIVHPIMKGNPCVVTANCTRELVMKRWPSVEVLTSASELHALLSGGVRAWQVYRDQVVANHS